MTAIAESEKQYRKEIARRILDVLDHTGLQPIIFAGSGLSQRYFGAPTWLQLLDRLCRECPTIKNPLGYLTQKHNNDLAAVGSDLVQYFQDYAWGDGRSGFPDDLFEPGRPPDTYIKYRIAQILVEITPRDIRSLHNNDMIVEIESLIAIRPHAVITTNYDNLLENLFEDYETHVRYDVIYYNNLSFGDIHKIHGSCESHETMIFTKEDYSEFERKSSYLSAKLLTYFAEHLLIFVGYSASDANIRSILREIDQIIGEPGSLKKNIFFLEWQSTPQFDQFPAPERLISLGGDHSIRVNSIISHDFEWVFAALAQRSSAMTVNPKTLRAIMNRMYHLVRSDIPRQRVECDYETLERAANTDGELAKLFGVTVFADGSSANITHPHLLSQVATELGYRNWNFADKLIKKIQAEKGVDIKRTDNRYHIAIKTGRKTINRKYSDEAIDLLKKVRDGQEYEVNLSD